MGWSLFFNVVQDSITIHFGCNHYPLSWVHKSFPKLWNNQLLLQPQNCMMNLLTATLSHIYITRGKKVEPIVIKNQKYIAPGCLDWKWRSPGSEKGIWHLLGTKWLEGETRCEAISFSLPVFRWCTHQKRQNISWIKYLLCIKIQIIANLPFLFS